jgi:Ssp1 endopeptidase immunity protein Rap1a
MRAVVVTPFLVMGLFGVADAAETITGNVLYQTCSSPDQSSKQSCGLYIAGLLAGVIISKDKKLPSVCPPEKVTGQQAQLIVEKFMREHPDVLDLPANAIAYTALGIAFPCPSR